MEYRATFQYEAADDAQAWRFARHLKAAWQPPTGSPELVGVESEYTIWRDVDEPPAEQVEERR